MAIPLPAATRALAIPELVLEIISHLDQADLARVVRLSKEWQLQSHAALYAEPDILRGYEGYDQGWDSVCQRMALLCRTLESRADLGKEVAVLDVLAEGNIQLSMGGSASSESGTKQATSLLALCRELKTLRVKGFTQACSQIVGAAAAYCPQLTTLEIFVEEMPMLRARLGFNSFGPFLAAFTNLTCLALCGWPLPPESTAGWPKLTCQLTKLTLAVTWLQDPFAVPVDFDWLSRSSRSSLRKLFLFGCSHEILTDLAGPEYNLRFLTLVVTGDNFNGDFTVLTQLASRPELKQLRVIVPKRAEGTETHEAAIRAAVADANRKLGREAAVMVEEDSYEYDWI